MGSLTSPKSPRRSPRVPSTANDDAARALDALRRIVQCLRDSAAEAQKEVGISGAQLFVLQQLREGPRTINELAERTKTHQSSVSAVAQRLEQAHLAERRPVETDRRQVALRLTPRGRALANKAPPVAQSALLEAAGRLSPREAKKLAQGLERLAAEMGLFGRPPMFFEENRGRSRA